MAVLRNPESAQVKEMARWEMYPSEWTIGSRPGNPYIKGNTEGKPGSEYPKMIYQANRIPGSGKWATSMAVPAFFGYRDENEYQRAVEQARDFTRSCQKVVNNEDEELKARGQGWCATQDEAVALRQAEQDALGTEAAARNFRDQNMSEKAKAESAKAEAEHFGHLPAIPEAARVKRKYTRKAKPATSPA